MSFPLVDLLDSMSAAAETTDLTLYSDGRVARKSKGVLMVESLPALTLGWAEIQSEFFSKRPTDTREGYTKIILGAEDSKGRRRRFRSTLVRCHTGESIAVRPLPNAVPNETALRLPSRLKDYILGLRGGLFLVAGATGSGKSTTQACMLKWFGESKGGKIVTIEDPIEYVHESNDRACYEQRELGTHVLDYASGLKEALHQNPNIIGVQEIREAPAAETALAAALSGHLVFASIHAHSAATTPQRYLSIMNPSMEDIGARDALASCLEGVIAQRLLPGVNGLVPVFELMLFREFKPDMPRLHGMEHELRDGKWASLRQAIEGGQSRGMMTFEASIRQRIQEGLLVR